MPELTTPQIGALYFRITNLGRHRELPMAFRVEHFDTSALLQLGQELMIFPTPKLAP